MSSKKLSPGNPDHGRWITSFCSLLDHPPTLPKQRNNPDHCRWIPGPTLHYPPIMPTKKKKFGSWQEYCIWSLCSLLHPHPSCYYDGNSPEHGRGGLLNPSTTLPPQGKSLDHCRWITGLSSLPYSSPDSTPIKYWQSNDSNHWTRVLAIS